ncbi:U3 small nucleolar RNA-associated protein 25 [Tremella mesenterica]|uniref:U3 small nucleolar RNA-associated protein 25 n=1 Tax=Tremella mesenterica TaxID=5217 RepID=A0A4Q1BW78_TREME|nr:U3 small nucleolar RNA-associated protein 25 [Tremella mesenterica]
MSSATEVRLLTLLNITATRYPLDRDQPGGHRSSTSTPTPASPQPNEGQAVKRRKSVVFGGEVGPTGSSFVRKRLKVDFGLDKPSQKDKVRVEEVDDGLKEGEEGVLMEDVEESEDESGPSGSQDMFNLHFGPSPSILTPESISAADAHEWGVERKSLKGFGKSVESRPGKTDELGSNEEALNRITPALLSSLRGTKPVPLVSTSLSHLGTYKDFYFHSLDGEVDGSETKLLGEQKESLRQAIMVHTFNHVLKTRKRILKNNEKLSRAASSGHPIDPPRDQSFTRPKVLLLLPLRSLALHYLSTYLFPLAPPGTQIESLKPFTTSFSLPSDTTDPLAEPSATQRYPIDHLVNFRGNSDDNFRFGIKITRKAWRVVMMPANEEKLMDCDILVASPLGIKMTAEKEKSEDLLASMEIVVVDGMDVMQMQNWDHVQFIFDHLNKIPESPHGCDFSRVKPWYLDNQAKYLRQTILLSRYDTPEGRALFHRQCYNLAGKIRLDRASFPGVLERVRPGVKQVFERVDLGQRGLGGDAAAEEVDKRLEWFLKQTLPSLLRSAVSRQNTLVVVPSYFDFVRLTNALRKSEVITFSAISEYSSNSEISRARTTFFKSRVPFLIVTERFHFYRRYRLRGAKTLVFYSLPDHAQFYTEFLRMPFLGPGGEEMEGEVDEGEVQSRVLFSRFDKLKLERVVGSEDARRMMSSGEGRFQFT